ncbi:carotenoid oxygenase family protein [Sphingomonas sp. MMS24-J13]|uniref:carotenoid oxygenase family protein n=1 Tax=Sphingomonas sp. MMS24-J13 TaxID=3238686 RepID=UPI00384D6F53
MAHFPDTRGFTGTLRPLRIEGDILDLEIEGEIPPQLNGTFHRVHPDAQFPPMFANDQFFNGDGMVSLFHFHDGIVDFRQRYAQTDKWKLERAAGHALFGAYRNPLTDDPSVAGQIRGTANTNVMVHGGSLYAMKEDSPCLIMDPLSLETIGYTRFGGKLRSQTFCAHPKIDPATGNMCAFAYATKGLLTRDMAYIEIGPEGDLVKEIAFENPYYCMMHDFGVTEDYAVFHVVPIVSLWERLEAGLPHFGFDRTLPVYLGVLPRNGTADDIRWFKAPETVFASHVMNAFNEGTKIHFDTPVAMGNCFPFFPDVHGEPFDPIAARPYLTRWTVDMTSNSDTFESVVPLTDMIGEFPRIDDRFATRRHHHGWMLVMDPDMPFEGPSGRASGFIMNRLGHIDFSTGQQTSWWAGPQTILQEPCFVPRTPDAAEGDGYIIAVADNLVTNYSDLIVLDARKIAEGPIARAKLPIRLRSGLHGNWANATSLAA